MSGRDQSFEMLRKIDLFSSLDEESLQLLREKMKLVNFKKGDLICGEGEPGFQKPVPMAIPYRKWIGALKRLSSILKKGIWNITRLFYLPATTDPGSTEVQAG